jgi:serine/threonine-protein kinase
MKAQPDASPSSYVRVCELAAGGMGRVDLALRREGAFQRLYAIKRLQPHLRDDPEFRQMFLEEARLAGLIRHPNVISVLDVGEDDEGPYLVMDFVEGLPLGSFLAILGQHEEVLSVQTCVRIGIQIASGLHAAHEVRGYDGQSLNLVHRDLSPQNVIVGYDGIVRITDFGIAKAGGRSLRTSTGILKGKMAYMSPEQLQFEEPDRRSDLFALGVVLFEMVSGRRLYRNSEGADGARRILHEPPPDVGEIRPEVPASLVELLFRLLAKKREDRPATAAETARRLEEILVELLADEPAEQLDVFVQALGIDRRAEQRDQIQRALTESGRLRGPVAETGPLDLAFIDGHADAVTLNLEIDVGSVASESTGVTGVLRARPKWPWIAGGVALAFALAFAAVELASDESASADRVIVIGEEGRRATRDTPTSRAEPGSEAPAEGAAAPAAAEPATEEPTASSTAPTEATAAEPGEPQETETDRRAARRRRAARNRSRRAQPRMTSEETGGRGLAWEEWE